jgi:hypothetical protein
MLGNLDWFRNSGRLPFLCNSSTRPQPPINPPQYAQSPPERSVDSLLLRRNFKPFPSQSSVSLPVQRTDRATYNAFQLSSRTSGSGVAGKRTC